MSNPVRLELFSKYFSRPVAETAAQSLSDGVEIAIQVISAPKTGASAPTSGENVLETLVFTREKKRNCIKNIAPHQPQLTFRMTEAAAEALLSDPSDQIGEIGVNILRLIFSPDPTKRIWIQFQSGFFTLWSKGYFGVLKAGGSGFAAYLASRGFSGMDAIKAALRKIRG